MGEFIITLDRDGVLVNGYVITVSGNYVELLDRADDIRHLSNIDFFTYDTIGLEQQIEKLYEGF